MTESVAANVTTRAFKSAMSQFASGVTIVTMRAAGSFHGLTVSAFTSVSAAPPLVLICVSKQQRSHEILAAAGGFAVNILSAEQSALGGRFAEAPPEERFTGLQCFTAKTGAPILRGSLAWMDCQLQRAVDSGDHSIFIGEVLAVEVGEANEAQPLVYYNRGWRRLHPGHLSTS